MPDSGKTARVEAFRLEAGARKANVLALDAADSNEIEAVRLANSASFFKRLQIGIGREVASKYESSSATLQWAPVAGGMAAHWEVSSTGARALRVGLEAHSLPAGTEIRFAGRNGPGHRLRTVHDGRHPCRRRDLLEPRARGRSGDRRDLRPRGRLAFRRGSFGSPPSRTSSRAPSTRNVESLAKASQSCEVDLICRSGDRRGAREHRQVRGEDDVLRRTGRRDLPVHGHAPQHDRRFAHARTSIPRTIASAPRPRPAPLTTHWFYDRTGCGTRWHERELCAGRRRRDAPLRELERRRPAAAPERYAAGGRRLLGLGIRNAFHGLALTAVHHPAGDLEEGEPRHHGRLRLAGRLRRRTSSFPTGIPPTPASRKAEAAGPGIFSSSGSGYRFRGGLYGGPSSCTASGSRPARLLLALRPGLSRDFAVPEPRIRRVQLFALADERDGWAPARPRGR